MDYNINEEIDSLMRSLADSERVEGDPVPEPYKNIIRLMVQQFGASAVVHQFMQIRFSSHGMTDEESQAAANGFVMGLQMAARHPSWARIVSDDMDEDEDNSEIAHDGQDDLARFIPLE
jgi:uncharacterized protein with von Willebrand factor type A (vWA) domain